MLFVNRRIPTGTYGGVGAWGGKPPPATRFGHRGRKFHTVAVQVIVDDRTNHATVIEDFSPKNVWAYFAHVDLNNFSLSGFQKFNK